MNIYNLKYCVVVWACNCHCKRAQAEGQIVNRVKLIMHTACGIPSDFQPKLIFYISHHHSRKPIDYLSMNWVYFMLAEIPICRKYRNIWIMHSIFRVGRLICCTGSFHICSKRFKQHTVAMQCNAFATANVTWWHHSTLSGCHILRRKPTQQNNGENIKKKNALRLWCFYALQRSFVIWCYSYFHKLVAIRGIRPNRSLSDKYFPIMPKHANKKPFEIH